MKMKSIQSTSISEIGYNRRTMNVKFHNGMIYEFKKVPRMIFDSFTKAQSKGRFFNDEIKQEYPFKKLTESM